MGSFSIWHWLIVLIVIAVLLWPLARILKRTGHSPWWALVWLVPVVNVIALWVLAYAKWPVAKDAA